MTVRVARASHRGPRRRDVDPPPWGEHHRHGPERQALRRPGGGGASQGHPRSSAHFRAASVRVILPSPVGPVITAPRQTLMAAVNWASSLLRPTSGQLATAKRSGTDSLSSCALRWHFLASIYPLLGERHARVADDGRPDTAQPIRAWSTRGVDPRIIRSPSTT
jgi:hypothetical protein